MQKNYVEATKISNYLKNKKDCKNDVSGFIGTMILCENCPVQHNEKDCGYHVCHIMDRVCNNMEIEPTLTIEEVLQFKAEMMTNFLKDYK